MTTSTIARTLSALSAAALIVTGCGGSAEDAPGSAAPSTPSAATVLTDQQAPPAEPTLEITIRGGEVTPTNAQLEAQVGQPIVIRVDSDAADELHVHSNPEHTFAVAPTDGQTFQFTVEVPGRVDVELHHTHTTVATIAVVQ